MKDFHECPHCQGQGQIPLTGVYAETLAGVRRYCARKGGHVVANRDWKQFDAPTPTALNNRLARLEEMGFVFSERFGRQRRFYMCSVKGK